ncbi:hypothetical protein [Cohnella zeiphila]|uniref:Uncharacterized protein n=1 Tax=Cohnella zeiphila TaxID=2761120 RepID=A0A7X0VVG8_9BACL|nr:hypothetical protein [Cohnella zeiphila]MBB6731332.1 hypothetical protein [Cohnella zeiphila]
MYRSALEIPEADLSAIHVAANLSPIPGIVLNIFNFHFQIAQLPLLGKQNLYHAQQRCPLCFFLTSHECLKDTCPFATSNPITGSMSAPSDVKLAGNPITSLVVRGQMPQPVLFSIKEFYFLSSIFTFIR